MAAPIVQATSQAASKGALTTTLTNSINSFAVGDLLVAVLVTDPVAGTISAAVVTGVTGSIGSITVEQDLSNGSGTSGVRIFVVRAFVTGAGSLRIEFTHPNTTPRVTQLVRISGVDSTTPVLDSKSSASAPPALTPVAGRDVLAYCWVGDEAPDVTSVTRSVSGQTGFAETAWTTVTNGTTGQGSATNQSIGWTAWSKDAATSTTVTPSATAASGTQVWASLLFQAPAGTAFTDTENDSAGLADSFANVAAFGSAPTDTTGVVDSTSTTGVYNLTFDDPTGLVDSATTNLGSTTFAVELWENGVFVTSLGTGTANGSIQSFTWDAASLTDLSGESVEIRLSGTGSMPIDAVDWLAVGDASQRVKTVGDPTGLTDTFSTTFTPGGSNFTSTQDDSTGLSDSTVRATSFALTFTDSAGLADSATLAAAFVSTQTDSAGLSDSATSVFTFSSTITDNAGFTDATTRIASFTVTATDSAGLTDSATPATAFAAIQTDSAGLTDTPTVVAAFGVTSTDSAGLSDSQAQAWTYASTFTDNSGLADAAGVASTLTLTDSAGLTDSAQSTVIFTQTNTDSAGLTDSNSRVTAFALTVTDSAGLTDAATTAATFASSLTDGAGLADSAAPATGFTLTTTDNAGPTDSTTRTTAFASVLTDNGGLTDSATSTATFAALATDIVGLTDASSLSATFSVTATESAGLTDTAAPSTAFSLTLTDSIGLTDSAVLAVGFASAFTDNANLTDTTTRLRYYPATLPPDAILLDPDGDSFTGAGGLLVGKSTNAGRSWLTTQPWGYGSGAAYSNYNSGMSWAYFDLGRRNTRQSVVLDRISSRINGLHARADGVNPLLQLSLQTGATSATDVVVLEELRVSDLVVTRNVTSAVTPWTPGDVLTLEVQGDVVRGYHNSTLVIEVTWPGLPVGTLVGMYAFYSIDVAYSSYAVQELPGLTGPVSYIQEDPSTTDGNYLLGGGAFDIRVSFPSPGGTLVTGAGQQAFRVRARMS